MAALAEEKLLFQECYRFYKSQYPKRTSMQVEESEWRLMCARACSSGLDRSKVASLIQERIRSETRTAIVCAEEEVFARFNRTRKAYSESLDRYAGRYSVTASAKSPLDIDADRNEQLEAVNSAGVAELSIDCEYDHWARMIRKSKTALAEINLISSKMAAKQLEWEKYLDDKRKLWLAFAALMLGLIFNGGLKLWEDFVRPEKKYDYKYSCDVKAPGMNCQLQSQPQ